MNEKKLYLALLKVNNNTSISELLYEGMNYSEITDLLKYIRNEGYITESNDSLLLSEKGNQIFSDLSNTYKKTVKKDWIRQDEKNIIKKMRKNDIFVPDSNELTFKIKLK